MVNRGIFRRNLFDNGKFGHPLFVSFMLLGFLFLVVCAYFSDPESSELPKEIIPLILIFAFIVIVVGSISFIVSILGLCRSININSHSTQEESSHTLNSHVNRSNDNGGITP